MKEDKIEVMVAVTLVGTIVYHKKPDSGLWQEPCFMQPLPDGRNVNVDRYGKYFESEGRAIDPIDERHIVSHGRASQKAKQIYWNSLEQFRVAESGIVRPKPKDVVDIGKSRGQ